MRRIDLNVDIGEGFPNDAALLEFATSANVCGGVHAGSWELTASTIELCQRKGVRIGAHPGYPNRETMGRTRPPDSLDALRSSLRKQVRLFEPSYVKPHGAWYNEIVAGDAWARSVAEEIAAELGVPIMILPVASLLVPTIREGFADRAYEADGSLRSRSLPGAVLTDPAEVAAQTLCLASEVDSICLHGDTPDALAFAELVWKTLFDAGYEVGA